MKIRNVDIQRKCNIYLLGDIHYPRGKREKFQNVMNEIKKDRYARMVGLGDYCEYIKDGDPRYDPQEMAHYIKKYGDAVNMVQNQFMDFENDIADVMRQGKILGLHEGNHEYQYRKRNSVNLLQMMCERNEVPYLGSNYVYWRLKYNDNQTTLLTNHGCGGGTSIGYHLKKLDSASRILNEVDVIAQGHCFDEETEILTNDGWKKHNEISKGDIVLTYNMDNESSEWNKINDLYKYTHYKKLIHFKNNVIDLMVTPDHTVIGKTDATNPIKKKKAHEILNKRFIMLNGGNNSNNEYIKYSDSELKAIAWILTEGCYESDRYIRISQSDKEKVNHKHITKILDDANIKYNVYERSGNDKRNYRAFRISIQKQPFLDMIMKNFPDKKLTKELTKLSNRQFRLFLDEIILADGYSNDYNSMQYCTKYDDEADMMQMLCAFNGLRSSLIKRHDERYNVDTNVITINTKGYSYLHNNSSKEVKYDGVVWCPSVDNGTVVVRRNGKVIVAGNTHQLTVNGSCGPLNITDDDEIKQNVQYRCSCGSFLGNYDLDTENYAEVQGYSPLPIGYVKLELIKGKVKSVQVVPV